MRSTSRLKGAAPYNGNFLSEVFVVTNTIAMDMLTGDGWWFYWITIIWGFGIVGYAWLIFSYNLRKSRKNCKIREILAQGKGIMPTYEIYEEDYFESKSDV
jgi:hypothetical protein